MFRKKTVAERLKEITKEHERKGRPKEWAREQLQWEEWESLSREALAIARKGLRGHGRGMVLPGGYDAESIAAQAIADLMSGKAGTPVGPTRERLVKKVKRLIQGKVRLLQMLKETSVTRSEWNADGTSLLNRVRDGCADVSETVAARETAEEGERLKRELKRSLQGEPVLTALLECRWEGVSSPAKIGDRLGMREAEVVRGLKRLDRRLEAIRKRRMNGWAERD